MAKTLLNFLTFSWGVEVAARPEFGIVKRAILTGESIATFVRLAPRREADSFDEVMTRPDHHTLCITAARGMVGGSLWLYQRAIASVILASNLTLQRHASVGLFNYKTRTHRLLSVEDLAAELCPSG